MAGVPFAGFGKDYAAQQGAVYDPFMKAIQDRISGLQGREAGAAGAVQGLFKGASDTAAHLGADVSNIGSGFLGAAAGIGSSLPGMDPTYLANAARSTARGGATGAMLGNVLGTQVGQAQATSTLEAQRRIADEITAQQDKYDQAQLEQSKVSADYLTPAGQRQQMASTALSNQATRAQLAQIPQQNRAAALANMAAQGSIDAQVLNNLDAMKKLGLSQADMVKARKLYGGIKAKGGSGGSGNSGGNSNNGGNNHGVGPIAF